MKGVEQQYCVMEQLCTVYSVSQQVEDITEGLLMLSSNAENYYLGSRSAVRAIGIPKDIDNDQGVRFPSHEVQEWADKNNRRWHFHLSYNPTAAELIERRNGLFNEQLRLEMSFSQHMVQKPNSSPKSYK